MEDNSRHRLFGLMFTALLDQALSIDESVGYKVGVTLGSAVGGILLIALVGIFFYMFYWKKWFGTGQSKWILDRSGSYPSRDIAKVDLSATNHAIGAGQPPVSRDFAVAKDFYQNQSYEDERRAQQQMSQVGRSHLQSQPRATDYLNSSVSSHASSEMAKAFQQRDRFQTSAPASGGSTIPAGYRGSAV